MEIEQLIGAVVVPVAAASLLLVVLHVARARWAWLGSPGCTTLVVAGAIVAAFRHQAGGLPFPPKVSFDWFPWAVVACAACTAALGRWLESPGSWRTPTRVLAAAACVALPSAVAQPVGVGLGTRVLWAGTALVSALCVATIAGRNSGHDRAMGVAAWGTAAALAGLVLLSHFAKLSLLAGTLSAASAAVVVLGLFLRPLHMGAPYAAFWAVTLGLISLYGMAYDSSEMPPLVWWCCAACPCASLLGLLPPVSRRPRLAAWAAGAAPIAMAAGALAAARAMMAPQADVAAATLGHGLGG